MHWRPLIPALVAVAVSAGVSTASIAAEAGSSPDSRFQDVGASQPTSFSDPLVEAIDFRSGVNGRDYSLRIRKPQSYASGDNRYPVMVVLDAESAFGMASDTAQLQAAWSHAPTGQPAAPIPEVILVGVALPSSPPDPFRRNFEFSPPGSVSDLPPSQREYIEKIKAILGRGPTFGGAADFLRVLG
jgi:predicted alpha/beta superfamily hydrolase